MPSSKDGIMVILSSPSGAGKTTLVNLLSKLNNFEVSISHTTREPRIYEIPDKDYYFVSDQDQYVKLTNGVDLQLNPNSMVSFSIHEGANCGVATDVACVSDKMNDEYLYEATAGDTIWVRVWENFNWPSSSGYIETSMCVRTIDSPLNDDPCNAINLVVDTNLVLDTYSSIDATPSDLDAPICGQYEGADVWFYALAGESGTLVLIYLSACR